MVTSHPSHQYHQTTHKSEHGRLSIHHPTMATATTTGNKARSSGSVGDDADQELMREQAMMRPRNGVPFTAEEKVLRRRLQYKLHQRRHRAKQKDTTLLLEQEVTALAESVARLENEWQIRFQSRNVFSSRGSIAGAPTKVAMEYLRFFEHGFVEKKCEQQARFVRSVMLADVDGPDYKGIDTLMAQWRLYSSVFLKTQYHAGGVEVSTIGEMTVVVVNVVLTIRSRRDGLSCLYPSLRGKEEILQDMIRKPIHVPGKLRFVFEENGKVSWFGTDMDFVAGLQTMLGSLDLVAMCMEDARMSFSTGQIAPSCVGQRQWNSNCGKTTMSALV